MFEYGNFFTCVIFSVILNEINVFYFLLNLHVLYNLQRVEMQLITYDKVSVTYITHTNMHIINVNYFEKRIFKEYLN